MKKTVHKLSNGLTLWHVQLPERATASLHMLLDAGSNRDNGVYGLAHFVEHLLFEGSSAFTGRQIKEYAAYNGLSINAGTGKEFMVVEINSILEQKINEAAFLLKKIVLGIDFSNEKAFLREKKVVLSEIGESIDNPSAFSQTQINGLLLEESCKYPILGFGDIVSNIDFQDVKRFYNANIVPGKSVICYAGSADVFLIKDIIEKKFSDWVSKAPLEAKVSNVKLQKVCEDICQNHKWVTSKHQPSSKHILINLVYPTTEEREALSLEEEVALSLAEQIFGGSWMISRMFKRLREEKGLCYGSNAVSFNFATSRGYLRFKASVEKNNKDAYVKALQELISEVKTVAPFEEIEFEAAKLDFEIYVKQMLDSVYGWQNSFVSDYLYKVDGLLEKFLEIVSTIKLKDVQSIFNKVVSKEPIIVEVGNLKLDSKMIVSDYGDMVQLKKGDDNVVKSAPPIDIEEEEARKKKTKGDEEDSVEVVTRKCSLCGKSFEAIAVVDVDICPDCKVKKINGLSDNVIKKINVYSSDAIVEMDKGRSSSSSGASSVGTDYGSHVPSSMLKPAQSPEPVGKSSSSGSADAASAQGGGGASKPAMTDEEISDKADLDIEEANMREEMEIEAEATEWDANRHPRDSESGRFIDS